MAETVEDYLKQFAFDQFAMNCECGKCKEQIQQETRQKCWDDVQAMICANQREAERLLGLDNLELKQKWGVH